MDLHAPNPMHNLGHQKMLQLATFAGQSFPCTIVPKRASLSPEDEGARAASNSTIRAHAQEDRNKVS